jgi:hypothetical protein
LQHLQQRRQRTQQGLQLKSITGATAANMQSYIPVSVLYLQSRLLLLLPHHC